MRLPVYILCLLIATRLGAGEPRWLVNLSTATGAGMADFPATAVGLPAETVAWRDQGGAAQATVQDGVVRVHAAPGPLGTLTLDLVPADAAAPAPDASAAVLALLAPAGDGQFAGPCGEWTVTVTDGNGNGLPDLEGDRWRFVRADGALFGLLGVPAPRDPLGEGRLLLGVHDLDGNGELDDREWQRPAVRFADRDGDGLPFTGNIFAGQLGNDAIAMRRAGSPDGRLWDLRLLSLDLDADGDPDITVGIVGTEASLAGSHAEIYFDFADRDPPVRYQFGPGALSVDVAAGAWGGWAAGVNRGDITWRLIAEELRYELPEGGAGSLATADGNLRHLILRQADVQVTLQVEVDLAQPPPPIITYGTERTGQLRVVSAILPTRWDGRALPLTPDARGHVDISDQAPWARAVEAASAMSLTTGVATDFRPAGAQGPATVYASTLLPGHLHLQGASHGLWSAQGTHYDDDGDGLIDHYLHSPDPHQVNEPVRSLRLDRANGNLTFRQDAHAVQWVQRVATAPVPLYLENAAEALRQLRQGTGQPPLLTRLRLNEQGMLPGYPAKAVRPNLRPFWIDGWHANRKLLFLDAIDPRLVAPIRRVDFALVDRVTPFLADDLGQTRFLLITEFARGPADDEVRVLRHWLATGGTLILAPARLDEAQRTAMNALLNALDIAASFGPLKRLGDDGYPTSANQIAHFTDTTGQLLGDSRQLSLATFTIVDARGPLLLHDGAACLDQEPRGQGRVILTSLPMLADNPTLARNFFRWLSQLDRSPAP